MVFPQYVEVPSADYASHARNAVLEYKGLAQSPLSALFDSTAAHIINTPGLTQPEAVCYSRDGRDILTTSEGSGPPLVILRRKN